MNTIVENVLDNLAPTPSGVYDRKERRFFVASDQTLRCQILQLDDNTKGLRGEVINVSTNGIQVKTSKSLKDDEQLVLKLSIPDYSNDITVQCNVRWEALTPDKHYYLGCIFDEPIDPRILTHLASLGMLERRSDDRKVTNVDAFAQQQLSDPSEIQIIEYSKGGLSFSSTSAMDLDSRIKITFPDSDEMVIVTPAWQIEKLNEYKIGCSFNNNHSYRVIGEKVATRGESSFLSRSKTNWLRLGVFTIVVWGVFKLCGF